MSSCPFSRDSIVDCSKLLDFSIAVINFSQFLHSISLTETLEFTVYGVWSNLEKHRLSLISCLLMLLLLFLASLVVCGEY